eukprot:gene24514-10117_t
MTAFGHRGIELVKEIYSHSHDSISCYNEELIRLVFSEIDEHQNHLSKILQEQTDRAEAATEESLGTSGWENRPGAAVSLVVHLESIGRNKRLLLAYMLQRMERLKSARWEQRAVPQHMVDMISPQEQDFYRNYDRILTKYMSKADGIGQDLTLDTKPPKDISIQVKVLRSVGETIFSFGRTILTKGHTIFVPSDEAEPMIKSGILEAVDRKEFV